MKKIIAIPGLLLALVACSSASYLHKSCVERQGYCFDATINGQPVIPLQSRALLTPYQERSHYVSDTAWQLARPVSGPIDVQAAVNDRGHEWLGPRGTIEISVVPLGDYQLTSTPKLSKRQDVRIGGDAAVVVEQVLDDDKLPSGRYLFRIKASGENWDRKTVFVIVE
jgi:hypothetical protein